MNKKFSKFMLTSASALALLAAYPSVVSTAEVVGFDLPAITAEAATQGNVFIRVVRALPSVANITSADAASVRAARNLYNSLPNAEKANADVTRWAGYLADKEAALPVDHVRNFLLESRVLPNVAEINAMNATEFAQAKVDLQAARASYAKLTDAEKANADVARWAGYLTVKEDAFGVTFILAAKGLPSMDAIGEMDAEKLVAVQEDIDSVRELYDALSDVAKADTEVARWIGYVDQKEEAAEGKDVVVDLEEVKATKTAEIEAVVLSQEDTAGKTEESIALAEAKLKELKEAALEAVEAAETEEEVEAVEVDTADALALLEKELVVESVSAINKTTVNVSFNQAVDAAEASNFSIEGATVNSATLSEDKTSVRLDVSGLAYNTNYTLVTVGVVVNGEATATISSTFTTPAVDALWNLVVTPASGSIEANGTDNTTVRFTLVDQVTGEVDTAANDMVLSLNSTYGNLAAQRVTIQNGQATVVLRSEFNASGVTAKIDAQIIEASGDYQDLIGEVVGTANVQFVPSGSAQVDATYLTAANTNQADRVTLTFDNDVSVADFVKTDSNGRLTGDLRIDNRITVSQGNATRRVVGYLPGPSSNTLVAVLAADNVLDDNSDVSVRASMTNTSGQATVSTQAFKITDARRPEVTSVNPVGMNKLSVRFSEAVVDADFLLNARYTEGNGFTVVHGTFKFNPETRQFEDNRSFATISLTENYKESTPGALAGYFTAGRHALQVSKIKDFAALTDSNNIGTTQSLEFAIAANPDVAQARVLVDSPNQYRVAFDKDATLNTNNVKLQVYNGTQWVDATSGAHRFAAGQAPDLSIRKISGDTPYAQYKVEVRNDWTTVYNTGTSRLNYYNDQFRLVIGEGALATVVNGKTNQSVVTLPLNFAGSAMNQPDVTSPVIQEIESTPVAGRYLVTMSEPVATLAQEVEFIGQDKDGNYRTFKGASLRRHTDGLDNKFYVEISELEDVRALVAAGAKESWQLVLKNIPDDIGNRSATATGNFSIASPEELKTDFEIFGVEGVRGSNDIITVTFSDNVAITGNGSVTNVANYTLNGTDLPVGTSIRLGATDKVVVITLPSGTLGNSNVITVGRNLQSKDGKALTGEYSRTFTTTASENPVVDKTALQTAVETAVALDNTDAADYEEGALDAYQTAIDAAQAVLDNANATQAEVDAAVDALADATTALEDAKLPEVGEGVVVSDTTAVVRDNGLGEILVGIQLAELTGELEGAEGLVLTVNGKEYTAQKVQTAFIFNVPKSDASEEEVKAGKITAVN